MLQISQLQRKLLESRDIKEENWENFLKPDFESSIYDPFLLPDMEKAVDRILIAIKNSEKIIIYTDYDCDGIPAGAILHDFFKEIGYKNFSNYIPHRHNEGYGLHKKAIETFARDGVTLLITADLGITNIDEVLYAQELGIDIVLTDHHLPHTETIEGKEVQILPKAYAVINTKRHDNQYPDNMICGAATAWKLVCALVEKGKKKNISGFEKINQGFLKWQLDLVGIATISDMVPLVNENRVLAYYGLIVIRKTKRPGLQALFKTAKLNQSEITEDDIAFSVAPRLNAASRMDSPTEALKLLIEKDEAKAKVIALNLDKLNALRKESVATHMKKAHKLVKDRLGDDVLVVGDSGWGPGVLGLIAGKLQDEYKKTIFVWGQGEDKNTFKGSCRSDGRTHLVDLMQAAKSETFSHMGGHELAGGFSVPFNSLHNLPQNINEAYKKISHRDIFLDEGTKTDGQLEIENVGTDIYNELLALAPFGVANHKPTFVFNNCEIKEVVMFGATKNHLKLVIKKDKSTIEAIKFFSSKFFTDDGGVEREIKSGDRLKIIGNIEKESFGYKRNIRIKIVELSA